MKTLRVCIYFFLIAVQLPAQTPEAVLDSLWRAYIFNFRDVAMDEMERSGVPASIKLAQGILESRAGTSELAIQANNHFGIKCGHKWSGKSYRKDDDEHNKKGVPVLSCFRKYDSVVECFADHSEFIRNPEKKHRYGFLFFLDPLDYKGWAQGLQDAGYSTVDYYAEKLIFFIERYRLYEYDALAYNGRATLKRLAQINGVKMVQARPGESLLEIARLYKMPVDSLVLYNDYGYRPAEPLSVGTWVYMQSKRDSWSGPAVFHEVTDDQQLFDIAQLYGLQLTALRQRNRLSDGEEPAPGARIRLQGKPAAGENVATLPAEDHLEPQALPPLEARTHAGESATPGALLVEMLPETPLAEPVPAYWPATRDSASTASSDPSLLLLDHEDPQPLIILDVNSGEMEMYHTVAKGDTLYSIARRYGVSTIRLRDLNQIKNNNIKVGQSLRVN